MTKMLAPRVSRYFDAKFSQSRSPVSASTSAASSSVVLRRSARNSAMERNAGTMDRPSGWPGALLHQWHRDLLLAAIAQQRQLKFVALLVLEADVNVEVLLRRCQRFVIDSHDYVAAAQAGVDGGFALRLAAVEVLHLSCLGAGGNARRSQFLRLHLARPKPGAWT